MADLPSWVLDTIDTNWQPGNFDPQPILYNEDDGRVRNFEPEREPDLTDNNIVTVNSAPDTRRTPIGTEFHYRIEPGVTVRVEAVDQRYRGADGDQVADHADFGTLVAEVQRTVNTERTYPSITSSDVTYVSLVIETESDLSSERPDGYYELTFDIRFKGYEEP